jgi:outer membrane assembly lipoprotein YfiO
MRIRWIAAIAVTCWTSAALAAPRSWEYAGGGQWPEVASSSTTTGPTSDSTLDHVERLLRSNHNEEAEKLAIDWLLSHKNSPLHDRGLYLVAEALYQYGDRIKSYYYLDELMDEHPSSPLYSAALQRQYDIADAYLRGYKRRFLKLPLFTAEDEAVEMLYRIQTRSPGSPLAERSLLRTADYYFADKQYDFAADAYAVYLRQYPRSPEVPRVKLKEAYSYLAQFHGPRFDATPAIDAREQLSAIMQQYPKLAQEENIAPLLGDIDTQLAKKLYLTADFYRRTHETQAAVYTYRYLTKAYPASEEAKKAQAELRKMPQWALNLPEPKVQDISSMRTPEMPAPKMR